MNFARLPSELSGKLIQKCKFRTVIKMKQTNSNINTFIRKNKLDKIEVDEIKFDQYAYQQLIEVTITDCPIRGYFKGCYAASGSFYINRILQQILNSIKSARSIKLSSFVLDRSLIRVLNEYSNIFKDVSVELYRCEYEVPRTDLLPFWKIFKTVLNDDCTFLYDKLEEVLTDEMMLQALPNVTFNTVLFAGATALTDKTLEILENTRPPHFYLSNCTTNYTLEGIKQLFLKIVHSRDPSVISWNIGGVPISRATILLELIELQSEYSTITATQGSRIIKIEYKKEGTDETGILTLECNEHR